MDYYYVLAAHILFWSYNMIDAAFFDWNDPYLSIKMDERNNQYLTLNLRF